MISFLQVVVTGLGAFFVDKAGRKPLLLVSCLCKRHQLKISSYRSSFMCRGFFEFLFFVLLFVIFFSLQVSGSGLVLGCMLAAIAFYMKVILNLQPQKLPLWVLIREIICLYPRIDLPNTSLMWKTVTSVSKRWLRFDWFYNYNEFQKRQCVWTVVYK